MSDIYKGELQDYEGNTIYPHTEADIVFMTEGQTVEQFLRENVTEEQIKSLFVEEEN